MNKMNKKSIIILTAAFLILILFQAASASAWVFPWQNQAVPSNDAIFNELYTNQVSPINTIENINTFSPYMDEAGYKTVKIYIPDLNKEFYILTGQGTTLTRPAQVDKTISLSSQQVKNAASILKDGKITYIEEWQLYFMLRWS